MDLYSEYLKEREGKECISNSKYLVIYKYYPESRQLYIADFFVSPEYRKQKVGTHAMDLLLSIAKERQCTHLACTTDKTTNNWEKAHAGLLNYGFIQVLEESELIYYRKEIEYGK